MSSPDFPRIISLRTFAEARNDRKQAEVIHDFLEALPEEVRLFFNNAFLPDFSSALATAVHQEPLGWFEELIDVFMTWGYLETVESKATSRYRFVPEVKTALKVLWQEWGQQKGINMEQPQQPVPITLADFQKYFAAQQKGPQEVDAYQDEFIEKFAALPAEVRKLLIVTRYLFVPSHLFESLCLSKLTAVQYQAALEYASTAQFIVEKEPAPILQHHGLFRALKPEISDFLRTTLQRWHDETK